TFVYGKDLAKGANATFTVWFKTLTNGTIQNNVTARSNVTNDTPGNNTTNINPVADLEVNKTVSNATAHYGDVITWTITVKNNGPNTAVDAWVDDIIPSELVDVSVVSVDQGNFANNVWTIGNLTKGQVVALVISTKVNATNTTIVNNVTVNSTTYDSNETNNNGTNNTTIPPEADLEVNKTVSNATARFGDVITWTITVTNNGPNVAVNVTVTDVIPDELINPEVINLGHAGRFEDNVWFIDEIASGDSKVLVIRTVVNATNATIVNNVNVTSDTYDPNETNNNGTNNTTVPPEADLEVIKGALNESAHNGEIVDWFIIVVNHGPDTAVNAVLDDVLPDELIFSGVLEINAGELSADGKTWAIGNMTVDQRAYLRIRTIVNTTNMTIVNSANASSETYDPDMSNNNDSDFVVIPPEADLEVIKAALNGTAHKGDVVDWIIVVVNHGPDTAVNAVLDDVLPDELIYNGVVNITAGELSADGKTWTIGNMTVDQVELVVIRTIVNATNMSLVNEANVSSETYDPNMNNNNDSDVVVIPPESDLSIVKLVSNDTAHKGDLVSWTIVVTNNGPDTAVNVVVEDVIPSGLDVVNVSGGNFADNTWTVGDLASGESATLIIETLINVTDATIVNNVNTTSDTYDPDESNNNGTNSTTVPPEADLEVIKTNDQEGAKCYYGDPVNWDITVVNHGPNDAVNAVVVDKLPAGVEYDSDDSNGAYDPETGVWNVGDLASGASVTLHIVTIITESNVNITNPVNVTSDTHDPDESNNKDNSSVNVEAEADLVVNKSVSNSTPHKGDKINWTIVVTNNGRDTAVNTIVTDKLPSGLIYVSDDSNGAYDSNTGIWKVGDLACGKSATLNIVTLVAATNKTIINIVDVTSDTYDPNETNNKGNNSTTVSPEVDLVITVEPDVAKVNVGDKVVWTITVVNQGPDTAVNSRAYVTVPDELKLLGFKPSKGTYDPDTGIWTIGDLAPGEEVTLLLDTKALVAGKFVVKAYTECDTYEIDYTNNFDDAEVEVVAPPENETEPEPPVVPVPPTMHPTGNPIVMALLSLLAVAGLSLKRKS
ncbi:DUF11 domain-containing protein, partial [Methanobrevibacter sp.]|uniref:DUF11 domain-containing protein n=1 Tax=Methanobrevibacter sp. TaxID=66852 RepID=UPI0038681ADE